MNIDLEKLLADVPEDPPCGPDLEYDPDFLAMEEASRPTHADDRPDDLDDAGQVDYRKLGDTALRVLERAKDIRAAVYLAEAALRQDGFPEFAKVMAYFAETLENHWDGIHPLLDEEDDNDPTMRVNAARGLADRERLVAAVRRAPLTRSRSFGQLSLRDLAIAEGEISAPADMSNPPNPAMVNAAFQETEDEDITEIRDALAQAKADVDRISAVFDDRIPGEGPDLTDLQTEVTAAYNAIVSARGGGEVMEEPGADEPAPAAGGAAPAARAPGQISSPDDVKDAIDRICTYYERNEPSSPVPMILARARRLVSADFLTIIDDIASDGRDQVVRITGHKDEDDDY